MADPVEVHLKNAKLSDIDTQVAQLRDAYELFKTTRKVTRQPGDFTMRYAIRSKTGSSGVEKLTTEQLLADAAKFRILTGIKEHVATHVGDVASFDLAFDLSCRRVPDTINPAEIVIGTPSIGM